MEESIGMRREEGLPLIVTQPNQNKKIRSNARNRSFSHINMVLYNEVKIQNIGNTGGEWEINT